MLMAAGAFVMLASAAHAQDAGKIVTETIPEQVARSVMKTGAVGVYKSLPTLPAEFDKPPAAGKEAESEIAPGEVGGKVIAAPDVTTNEARNYGCAAGGCGAGTNLNTVFHYSDHQLDPTLVNKPPYRASGYFLHTFDGKSFYYCTATLISKSILVTAGHCVFDTGTNKYIKSGTFYPACVNCNGGGTLAQPYGRATMFYALASAGWRNAASEGAALDKGVDVAVVVLNKRVGGSSVEMGTVTGFLGFCHTNCLKRYFQLSQIGYPSNYDGGNRMNYGEHIEQSDTRDFMLGSGMQGGSSGGPHVANIGVLKDSSVNKGQYPKRNVIFAVTSWGYVDEARKIQGSSPLSGPTNNNNFKAMFNAACNKARKLHGAASCTPLS